MSTLKQRLNLSLVRAALFHMLSPPTPLSFGLHHFALRALH